jgi:hypothetical protein
LQNVSEDTDDKYDELFNKYGKVVFRRNDQKPQSEEVDDDAESLSCKLIVQPIERKISTCVSNSKILTYLIPFFIGFFLADIWSPLSLRECSTLDYFIWEFSIKKF